MSQVQVPKMDATKYRHAELRRTIAALLLALSAGCSGSAARVPGPGQHEQRFHGTVKREVSARYLVYLPRKYQRDGGERWPLMLFLHGAGERGDTLQRLVVNGPPRLVTTNPDFPFVVVTPQAGADSIWSNLTLDALIDEVVQRYRLDPDRIYLTGLSMGGYGVWQMAMEFPRRFAAIVPVASGGVPSGACALKHLPIWAFHGAKDDIIPVDRAQQIVERVRACPGRTGDVRFTVYPEANHDSWTRAYADTSMYSWLLRQRRKPDSASAQTASRWWKGNTHTHTLWSDGDDFPEMVAEWYKQNGYNFVALSDHNTLSDEQRWWSVSPAPMAREALDKYRRSFGQWVQERTRNDSLAIRLRTPAEYKARIEVPGTFLLMDSEEITQYLGGRGAHMTALNIAQVVPAQSGATLIGMLQRDLSAIATQRKATGRKSIGVLNHPNFLWSQTAEDVLELPELRFFEVYNGHPLVYTAGDSLHASNERIWDIVLTSRMRAGGALLYGVATDDSHDYHRFGRNERNTGRGWIMVRSPRLDQDGLIAAMEQGDFYASNGVVLRDVKFNGRELSVDIEPSPGVTYTTQFIGTRRGYDSTSTSVIDSAGRQLTRRYSSEVGAVLAEVRGTTATYNFRGDEYYVRARVTSSKPKANASYAGEIESAWIQPVRMVRP